MDSYEGFVSWIRMIGSYQRFISWIRMKDSYQGFVSWIHIMDSYHGFVSWTRIKGPDSRARIQRCGFNGLKHGLLFLLRFHLSVGLIVLLLISCLFYGSEKLAYGSKELLSGSDNPVLPVREARLRVLEQMRRGHFQVRTAGAWKGPCPSCSRTRKT